MNDFDIAPNSPSFVVRGHTVKLLSPSMAHISILVPEEKWNEPLERQEYVFKASEQVVEYLIFEKFLDNGSMLNIIVESRYN